MSVPCRACGHPLRAIGNQPYPDRVEGIWRVLPLGQCDNPACGTSSAMGESRPMTEPERQAWGLPPLKRRD